MVGLTIILLAANQIEEKWGENECEFKIIFSQNFVFERKRLMMQSGLTSKNYQN
jgi:hypothetical protein